MKTSDTIPELTISDATTFPKPGEVDQWEALHHWAMDNNMVWRDTVDRLRSVRLSPEDSLRILASQLLRANVKLTEELVEAAQNRPVQFVVPGDPNA